KLFSPRACTGHNSINQLTIRTDSMVEKEVEMSSTGELNFKIPQQEWTGKDAIQNSYFAGQELFIKRSEEQVMKI
ncbi:MAG: hypothetical protein ACU0DI_06805, partial [Paracoccaceae bacterium]